MLTNNIVSFEQLSPDIQHHTLVVLVSSEIDSVDVPRAPDHTDEGTLCDPGIWNHQLNPYPAVHDNHYLCKQCRSRSDGF